MANNTVPSVPPSTRASLWSRFAQAVLAALRLIQRAAKSEPIQTVRGPVLDALAGKYGSSTAEYAQNRSRSGRLVRALEGLIAAGQTELQARMGRRTRWRRESPTAYRLSVHKLVGMADQLDDLLRSFQGLGAASSSPTPLPAPAAPAAPVVAATQSLRIPTRSGLTVLSPADRLQFVYQYVVATARQILDGLSGAQGLNEFAIRAAVVQMAELARVLRDASLALQ